MDYHLYYLKGYKCIAISLVTAIPVIFSQECTISGLAAVGRSTCDSMVVSSIPRLRC